MNGEVCCILGVCCPPASVQQRDALAHAISDGVKIEYADCERVAEWVLKNFDLAPAGFLSPLLVDIAKMAREHPPHDE